MKILAIETSCDDTCVALIEVKDPRPCKQKGGPAHMHMGCGLRFKILSNIVSSQVKLHAKYGGIYPFLAKREHQRNLPTVFQKSLRRTRSKQFDLIGVTTGPGLEPCLWQGINFAKEIAKKYNKPLISVNHIEAHIVANFIRSNFQLPSSVKPSETGDEANPHRSPIFNFQKLFPAVCLVVSGGHTQLILMRGIGKYKLIGETRDDAAGECFDKAARILGLGYPGGPIIDQQADRWESEIRNSKFEIKLPRPMIYQKNYDFSFSGLKTAVLYDFRSRSLKVRKSKKYIQEMCHEVQQAIIDVLIYKTIKAAKNFKVKSIILGGGVVANDELRKQFSHQSLVISHKLKLLVPPKILCTDNAAMIAASAYFHQKEKSVLAKASADKAKNWQKIKADANLRI